MPHLGEMAEWSIALPWKGSNWVTGSGVRIPVSPPILYIPSIVDWIKN